MYSMESVKEMVGKEEMLKKEVKLLSIEVGQLRIELQELVLEHQKLLAKYESVKRLAGPLPC